MKKAIVLALLLVAAPLWARERLGAWQSWAAFEDRETPRCYAIGAPEESSGTGGYVSVGFWPKKRIGHQVYVRLSKPRSPNSGISLNVGGRRFRLVARSDSGLSPNRQTDLAIIAAIRSSSALSVESTGRDGRAIIDAYATRGAASAIDAAALGCAR